MDEESFQLMLKEQQSAFEVRYPQSSNALVGFSFSQLSDFDNSSSTYSPFSFSTDLSSPSLLAYAISKIPTPK
jgi:hypothetical protein